MSSVGSYLKKQRAKLSLSLNDVCEQTGITTTRLNRIERNQVNEPSPEVLKKLAVLYQIDLIYLYKLAGYMENVDVTGQIQPFINYEILDKEEREFIQNSIDFLAQKHFKTK
ncbi:helix-turn-helix domain-containing protein [Desulfitobacterium sp. PCE1]|uniref:helix-turn-helix domain-containing protein n=1 Tax=Desulfitobacterium sp. PCE1 TaxID=146907 RepID=UPI00035C9B63|nr:helix-turn-helix transcriptional regulator [Desulfitobacterium sp. PCE1]